MLIRVALLSGLMALVANSAAGQDVQKLTAADGAVGYHFGSAVSISGDRAIIGAPGQFDRGTGSTYVFRRTGGNWIEEAKLTASDGTVGDGFGSSVSISGNLAIVGAPYDDDRGNATGSAYIFRRNAGIWTQEKKLLAPDGEPLDIFGHSVSISGDLAIVGENCSNNSLCYAHIYRRNAGLWTQEAKLTASDGWIGDWYAFSVSISGDLAIVGASGDDDNGVYTGSAYIYRRDEGNWAEEQKITASDAAAHAWFGWSVSISGDAAIVGASRYDDGKTGSAYVFRRMAGEWAEEQKLTASDRAQGEFFGDQVSISGDLAILGAPTDGRGVGSAYVFRRTSGIWVEEQKLLSPGTHQSDHFARSVAISGDLAIIGADLIVAPNAAYVYTLSSGTSTESYGDEIPSHYILQQNYPNPFNPSTTISYSLPRPSNIRLEVFDTLGLRVRILDTGYKPSGHHEVTFDASDLPSGVYFYKLVAGDFRQTRKIAVVK